MDLQHQLNMIRGINQRMARLVDVMHDLEDENATLRKQRQQMIGEIEGLWKNVDGLRSRLAFAVTSGVARTLRVPH